MDLLRAVHNCRFISTVQLLALFESESRDGIYERLKRLFHHAYLNRIGDNPNAPLIYSLAARGAEALDVAVRNEVGDRYLLHQLMITECRVRLASAARRAGIEVLWRQVPRESPVQPDCFFGLRFPDRPEGANRAFFFLEADRSTMPRGRFIEKLLAYERWSKAGAHTAALGIRSFRILTVTKSPERFESLLGMTARDDRLHALRPRCWFTPMARIGAIFDPIWQSAAEPDNLKTILP
jgi:hypothetical protein